jgi:hypothetical protein
MSSKRRDEGDVSRYQPPEIAVIVASAGASNLRASRNRSDAISLDLPVRLALQRARGDFGAFEVRAGHQRRERFRERL